MGLQTASVVGVGSPHGPVPGQAPGEWVNAVLRSKETYCKDLQKLRLKDLARYDNIIIHNLE